MRSPRKGELRHDVDAQALGGRAGNFLVERSLQPRSRYARMAFRIGADADFLDTVTAQVAFLDHRERIGIGPGGIDVAADDQQAPHTGFAREAPQKILQRIGTRQPPRRDMDDRFEPRSA